MNLVCKFHDRNLGHVTVYQYDKLNRLEKTTDAENGVTLVGYDAAGNTIWEQRPDGAVVAFGYDQLNRPEWIDRYQRDPIAPTVTLNSVNGQTATFTGYVVSDWLHSQSFGYDPNGNRSWEKDPRGAVTDYVYMTDSNLLDQILQPNPGTGALVQRLSFASIGLYLASK